MQKIVILGAGTAGTVVANRLRRELSPEEWQIVVVDKDNDHHYQPGYLFVPFGIYSPRKIRKSRRRFIPKGVEFIEEEITGVDADAKQVTTVERTIDYDFLIIASGTQPRPDVTPGLKDGGEWYKSIFDFYTFEGAVKLRQALKNFKKGRLVLNICEMPIKCPVAPLEFVLLADDFFFKNRVRDDVTITFVTPLDGAFTKPVASKQLGDLIKRRDIELVTDFFVESVDNKNKKLMSYDMREVEFDLLVTIPTNMGQQFIIDSGLGDDLGFIPVNHGTLQSVEHKDVFVLGDATNVPTSKAGSVAHFQTETFIPNFINHIHGKEMTHRYDGHSNCFIESGKKQALLLDFNYNVQPLTGRFPIPYIGPLALLKNSYFNHLGKLGFYYVYWNLMMRGIPLPVPHDMPIAGKDFARWGLNTDGTRAQQKDDPAAVAAEEPEMSERGRKALEEAIAASKQRRAALSGLIRTAPPEVQQAVKEAGEGPVLSAEAKARQKAAALLKERAIEVNKEGFMTDWTQWDEEVGEALATMANTPLTPEHWEIIRFTREDYGSRGATPTLRRMAAEGGFDVKRLFQLFPGKPAKVISYIAGVPKPVGCV